ncbi:MAG: maleylpyruvate isomerase family mycothiol-dependent enzyme [Acidimicrobiales bacterium]
MAPSADAEIWIEALRGSHDHLSSVLSEISSDAISGPSYCRDWTIAQVLSHLGSGAEIMSMGVGSVLNGEEPPGREMFQAVWDTWNAKSPSEQAADYEGADNAFLEQLASISPQQRDTFKASLFGMELDLTTIVGMRLSEHTLHTWDIEVIKYPSAELQHVPVELLIDLFAMRAARAGKSVGEPVRVLIDTTLPPRSFLLSVDESASVEEGPDPKSIDSDTGILDIPAEALLRLASGRLDDAHTPSDVKATGVGLDTLRQVFPGF